jgi:AcrR family transcriptional regulator
MEDREQPSRDGGRRGTPKRRTPDREGTRDRIIDAAQRLFAEQGFDATSTASVAAAAEVPGGLIFYYFATKRDLLLAVVRERAYRGSRSLSQVIAEGAGKGPDELLRRAVEELAAVFHRNRDTSVILFREAHTHPELRDLTMELMAISTADLVRLLAGLPEEWADADGKSALARLVISGLLLENFLQPAGADPAHFEPMVRLLAAAMSRPGPTPADGDPGASAHDAESVPADPASMGRTAGEASRCEGGDPSE